MAPTLAERTSLAYLPSTPRRAGRAAGTQSARRFWSTVRIDVQFQPAAGDVEGDRVAVLDQCDRTALGRLGRDVPHTQAGGPTREPAVGDQHDVLAQSGALDRGGDGQHLAHAGASLGSLVTDHHDVAGHDRAVLQCVHRRPLAIEDPSRAAPHRVVEPSALHHRPLGSERTVQDGDPPGRMDRVVQGPHDRRRRRPAGRCRPGSPPSSSRSRSGSRRAADRRRAVLSSPPALRRPGPRRSSRSARTASGRRGVAPGARRGRSRPGSVRRRPRWRWPGGAARHWSSRRTPWSPRWRSRTLPSSGSAGR